MTPLRQIYVQSISLLLEDFKKIILNTIVQLMQRTKDFFTPKKPWPLPRFLEQSRGRAHFRVQAVV